MTASIRLSWLGLLLSIPATAAAGEIGYQIETSVASGYVARGIVQYAHTGDASSQNTVLLRFDELGPGALAFSLWNAVALQDYDDQPGTALELDVSAAYAFPAGPLAVTTGYTGAWFPAHTPGTPLDGTHELWAMVSYDAPYVVPGVAAYAEVAHQQGVYLVASASRDLHHGPWTLSPAISVGCATYRKYLGEEHAAGPHVNDVTALFGIRLDLPHGMYTSARLSYALRGTPNELLEDGMDHSFEGRSSLFGALALGVAR